MSDPQSVPVLDQSVIATLKELGGAEEPGLFVELVDLFLEDAQVHLQALEKALATGDLKLLERTAHTLKSSSANVGALRFSRVCLDIELRSRAAQREGLPELVARAGERYGEACQALRAAKD
jgi:HPt (histidine-containing phosphotransfer) domain-containing protein